MNRSSTAGTARVQARSSGSAHARSQQRSSGTAAQDSGGKRSVSPLDDLDTGAITVNLVGVRVETVIVTVTPSDEPDVDLGEASAFMFDDEDNSSLIATM
jgi:hypothetical protein